MSHIPVMLPEMLAALAPQAGGRYLDATFGGGGYSQAILAQADCTLWAIDRDPDAIARGAALAAAHPGRLHLIEGSFGDMIALLAGAGVASLDGVVLDLGVSSFQIDEPARGFSFRHDGPLDMRMGRTGTSAADLVAELSEAELADTLYQFGEERLSRRIARAIVTARAEAPIETTGRLAAIIRAAMPPARDGIHPATRSFQALRIRVNDELGEIERALEAACGLLGPGGRLVVVSFHSLEDRLVKRFFTHASGRDPAPSRHDPRGLARRRGGRLAAADPARRAAQRGRDGAEPPCPQRQAAGAATPDPGPRGAIMIKPFTCLCLLAACGSGLYLYSEKHRTALLDRDIGRVIRQTEAAHARTGILRAEWALLNEPGRLGDMAGRYLALHPMAPTQFVQLASLSAHLPAAEPQAAEPADEEDAPASAPAPVVVAEAPGLPAHHPMQPPVRPDGHAAPKLLAQHEARHAPHRVALADRDATSHDSLLAHGTPLPLAAPQPMGASVYNAMARPMRGQAVRPAIVSASPVYMPAVRSALGGGAALPPPVPFGR